MSDDRVKYFFEYYNGFPNIRVSFEISAETKEEAERKADEAIRSLRRIAFYESKYR
jgi:hypothetical protein